MRHEQQLRVLILRLGAMGDILHALPAVTALRAAHPGWFFGWAVEPQWRALLASDIGAQSESVLPRSPRMPLVDRIHTVAAKQWGRHPLAPSTLRDILAMRRELRAAHYDVCLDLQGAIRSAVIGSWARPARLVGEASPRESLARWWFSERVSTRGTHVIEQAAEVARAVVADALPLTLPCLPQDSEADAWCEAHVPAEGFVLLSPGAGWGAKRWPIDRYAAVAGALLAEGRRVVINASPAERELAEQIVALSTSAGRLASATIPIGSVTPGAIALVPTLTQLIALSRRATLAIAGDTGPLHLAAALGRPTVGIFGPTDPARNGPFHGEHRVLRHPDSRRDHTRRAEPEAGLLAITVDEVLAAARALLAPKPNSEASADATSSGNALAKGVR